MPHFHPEDERHNSLIEAIGKAAHAISSAITEGFKHMANAETQALADLSAAITAIGNAISKEIAALQSALAAQGVDNSPEIQQRVQTLNGLAANLTASLPVVPAAPKPTVTAVTPSTGPVAGGTSVTLTGIGFTGATDVSVGGVAATDLAVASDTSLSFTTPPNAVGADPVVVVTPAGSNDDSSTFIYA